MSSESSFWSSREVYLVVAAVAVVAVLFVDSVGLSVSLPVLLLLSSIKPTLVNNIMAAVYIQTALRTPVGAYLGKLKDKTAVQLGTVVVSKIQKEHNLSTSDNVHVIMGNVLQGNNGQAPARQVALASGLPVNAVCTTVNKVCSSGMKAVIMGCQAIRLGDTKRAIVGGMESMSTAPFYIAGGRVRRGLYGDVEGGLLDAILRDGLLDPQTGKHMGEIAEMTAQEMNICRQEQDQYALSSYNQARLAWQSGRYDDEIVVVENDDHDDVVNVDEEFTRVNQEKMATLKPAFVRPAGTITAGNASKLNDGASAMLLSDDQRGAIGEILAYGEAELEPNQFCIAPSTAIPVALSRAFPDDHGDMQKSLRRVTRVEINEAFSVVALANHRLLNLSAHPHIHYNGNGGAVSLGHPIGSSGCRIVVSLVHALQRGQVGVAAICNGGGGASALVVRRLID